MSKPIIVCADCGEEKEYYAKGLCKRCYMCQYQRRYYEANRKDRLAYKHRHYAENRDEELARHRRWQQNNPTKAATQEAGRRARKRGVANTLTPEQLEFERRIGEATYPGEELQLHHLVPLGKGNHSWGNIAFIPASLNMSIRDKLPEEIYQQGAFL